MSEVKNVAPNLFRQGGYKAVFTVCCLSINVVHAHPHITTLTLIRATTQALPHCLHYRIKGTCYWWVKDGFTGHPEATLKVAHYVPDVVVSVFNRHGDNPWAEANTLYDKPAYAVAKKLIKTTFKLILGGGRHSFSDVHENNVYFKEVSIVGNPAAFMLGEDLTIKSTVTPLLPYFNSFMDAISWRLGTEILLPQSWATTSHLIGPAHRAWGSVYPHEGFVIAANDAMAASVIAQRAANIITKPHRQAFNHVYRQLKNNCGSHCQAAPVKENDKKIRWQRIFPDERHRCVVFGKSHQVDHLNKISSHTQGRYVWILWRYYQGCIVPTGGGKYLGQTSF